MLCISKNEVKSDMKMKNGKVGTGDIPVLACRCL